MDLDIQVTKLKMLKVNYESNLFRLQDAIAVEYPQQIAKYEELTAAYEADIIHLDTALNTPFQWKYMGLPIMMKRQQVRFLYKRVQK